jgi:hypothetical protein
MDTELRAPKGYTTVQHGDGTVHAIDYGNWPDDVPLWRVTPVCDAATGVSSDEGGPSALHRRYITCTDCIAILT